MAKTISFKTILARAEKRKGGPKALEKLLPAKPNVKALEKLGDDPGPTCLVARPDTLTRVPMKVLVEERQVAPMGIGAKSFFISVNRPAPRLVAEK